MKKQKIIVIGGGIAGLVAACQLATRGFSVTLCEQHQKVGGRWQEVRLGKYRFDLAPPMIRMPRIFEQIFQDAQKPIDLLLRFKSLDISSRHFFANGSMLDFTADVTYLRDQFSQFSPEDYEGFIQYIETVHKLYRKIEKYTNMKSFLDGTDTLLSPAFLWIWSSVYPLKSMHAFHRKFFRDPRLLSLLNRYASIVGSSPYETPAFVTILAYLDIVEGLCIVEGGSHRLIEALTQLANELGVVIKTDFRVDEIVVKDAKVTGVRMKRRYLPADFVVSTVDIRTTKERLLKYHREEAYGLPSYSEFVYLLGVKRKYPHLQRHNFFFPKDYGREFFDLMKQNEWSLSPCLYVGYDDAGMGDEERSSLCIRVNVPSLSADPEEVDVKQHQYYRDNIIYWLENHWAFKDVSKAIEVEKTYGPKDWQEMTGAWRGSLYGDVFHGRKGFFRPALRDPEIVGLYFAGATTYPGSGGVFSAVSAIEVCKCIAHDTGNASS